MKRQTYHYRFDKPGEWQKRRTTKRPISAQEWNSTISVKEWRSMTPAGRGRQHLKDQKEVRKFFRLLGVSGTIL